MMLCQKLLAHQTYTSIHSLFKVASQTWKQPSLPLPVLGPLHPIPDSLPLSSSLCSKQDAGQTFRGYDVSALPLKHRGCCGQNLNILGVSVTGPLAGPKARQSSILGAFQGISSSSELFSLIVSGLAPSLHADLNITKNPSLTTQHKYALYTFQS